MSTFGHFAACFDTCTRATESQVSRSFQGSDLVTIFGTLGTVCTSNEVSINWGHDYPVFTRPFFLFALFAGGQPFPPLFSAPFRPFFPLESALSCREKGTAQSLERGSSRMDLSTKFGKEILSRNLLEKSQIMASVTRPQLGPLLCPENRAFTGFGARVLQPFTKSLETVRYYSHTKNGR